MQGRLPNLEDITNILESFLLQNFLCNYFDSYLVVCILMLTFNHHRSLSAVAQDLFRRFFGRSSFWIFIPSVRLIMRSNFDLFTKHVFKVPIRFFLQLRNIWLEFVVVSVMLIDKMIASCFIKVLFPSCLRVNILKEKSDDPILVSWGIVCRLDSDIANISSYMELQWVYFTCFVV